MLKESDASRVCVCVCVFLRVHIYRYQKCSMNWELARLGLVESRTLETEKKKVISIFLRFEAFECLHKTSELKHISLIEVYSSQLLNNFFFKIEKMLFFQVAKQN